MVDLSRSDLACAEWRKSSRSVGGQDCVEVAHITGGVAVRDSKNPAGPALILSTQGWAKLTTEAKALQAVSPA